MNVVISMIIGFVLGVMVTFVILAIIAEKRDDKEE